MANNEKVSPLVIDNARIIFKNFSGTADRFAHEGDRSFCVVIDDDEMAEKLIRDGWNLKPLTPRDPDEKPNYILKVKVSYRKFAPTITLYTNHKRTELTEDTIGTLQYARIEDARVMIGPSRWEVNGKTGISAYLNKLSVKIEDDPFAAKYADYLDDGSEDVPF